MQHKKTLTLILGTMLIFGGTNAALPSQAQAFGLGNGLGGVLLNQAIEVTSFNQQVAQQDGPGRNGLMDSIKGECGVYEGERENQLLSVTMTRLSAAIAKTDDSIKQKPFNYFVNPKENFNAFCSLGHNLSVNKGAFTEVNYNEDELAFIVAHEMGHGMKNHVRNRLNGQISLGVLKNLLTYQNTNAYTDKFAAVVVNYTVTKGYSLPNEWEADNLAFDYTMAADYNPGAGAAVWQRVMDHYGDTSLNFLGEILNPNDHPTNIQRRDNYAKKLTEYSNNTVAVQGSQVLVKGKVLMTATAETLSEEEQQLVDSMNAGNESDGAPKAQLKPVSAAERAYLIAGNIARAYYVPKTKSGGLTTKISWDDADANKAAKRAVAENGVVRVGAYDLVQPHADEPSAEELAALLNELYGAN